MDIANSARQSVAIPTRTKRRAMDWSLVLASQDIPTTIAFTEEHRWALIVEAQDYERAVEAIRQYRVENRHWGWRRQLPWSQVTYHAGAVPACLVLVLIYQISVEFPHLHNSWIL